MDRGDRPSNPKRARTKGGHGEVARRRMTHSRAFQRRIRSEGDLINPGEVSSFNSVPKKGSVSLWPSRCEEDGSACGEAAVMAQLPEAAEHGEVT